MLRRAGGLLLHCLDNPALHTCIEGRMLCWKEVRMGDGIGARDCSCSSSCEKPRARKGWTELDACKCDPQRCAAESTAEPIIGPPPACGSPATQLKLKLSCAASVPTATGPSPAVVALIGCGLTGLGLLARVCLSVSSLENRRRATSNAKRFGRVDTTRRCLGA